MKKLMFAALSMVCMFAVSSSTGASPGAGPTSAAVAPAAPEVGGCRWFCDNGPSFTTRAACVAACSTFCEPIC